MKVYVELEERRLSAYGWTMDKVTDKIPPSWVTESLERSETQINSGQTVPLDPVLDRLRASIARMKAGKRRASPKTAREA